MSCACGQYPCFCVPRCPEDCPESSTYTAENINLSGVGVLNGTVDSTFQFRGIRSVNSNISVAHNALLNTVDLAFDNSTIKGIETFANAATRANTAPEYNGQLGIQLDTMVPYLGTGLGPGDWETRFIILGESVSAGADPTVITLTDGAGSLTINGGANVGIMAIEDLQSFTFDNILNFTFANGTAITVSFTSTLAINGVTTLDNTLTVDDDGAINFAAGSELQKATVPIPGDSFIITTNTAGDISSMVIDNVLTTQKTQVWGAITGSGSRAAYTVYTGQTISNPPTQAEVQALDDAVVALSELAAQLLRDLINTDLPSF